MTNEEFQKTVLQQLAEIKATMVTKDDLHAAIAEQQKDVLAMLKITDTKTDALPGISSKIDRLAGDVSYLVRKAADHDDDIRELRKAK